MDRWDQRNRHICNLYEAGESIAVISETCNIGRGGIYRVLRLHGIKLARARGRIPKALEAKVIKQKELPMKSARDRANADVDAMLDGLPTVPGCDPLMVVLLSKILRELKEMNYRQRDTEKEVSRLRGLVD